MGGCAKREEQGQRAEGKGRGKGPEGGAEIKEAPGDDFPGADLAIYSGDYFQSSGGA